MGNSITAICPELLRVESPIVPKLNKRLVWLQMLTLVKKGVSFYTNYKLTKGSFMPIPIYLEAAKKQFDAEDFEQVLITCEAVLKEHPGCPQTLNLRGMAYWRLNVKAAAEADFRAAIEYEDSGHARFNLAIAVAEKDGIEAAKEHFDQARKLLGEGDSGLLGLICDLAALQKSTIVPPTPSVITAAQQQPSPWAGAVCFLSEGLKSPDSAFARVVPGRSAAAAPAESGGGGPRLK